MTQEEMLSLIDPEFKKIQGVIKDVPLTLSLAVTGEASLNAFKVSVFIKDSRSTIIAGFNLSQFPGNCGILVSHQTSVVTDYRRRGISTIFQEMKEKLAQATGYTTLYATTVPDNAAEVKILERSGWKRTPPEFVNKRTFNLVTIWNKVVPAKKIPVVQATA